MKSTSGLSIWPEELPRVRRQRLDVAALTLGVDGVERERRLARARQPGEDDQLVARQLEVDVAEVVLTRAADHDRVAGRVRHRAPWYPNRGPIERMFAAGNHGIRTAIPAGGARSRRAGLVHDLGGPGVERPLHLRRPAPAATMRLVLLDRGEALVPEVRSTPGGRRGRSRRRTSGWPWCSRPGSSRSSRRRRPSTAGHDRRRSVVVEVEEQEAPDRHRAERSVAIDRVPDEPGTEVVGGGDALRAVGQEEAVEQRRRGTGASCRWWRTHPPTGTWSPTPARSAVRRRWCRPRSA